MSSRRKIAIVGAGRVGAATAAAVLGKRVVHEIVLLDENERLARGVATDMRYGAVLQGADLRSGEAADLKGSEVVVVTAGLNELAAKATNPNDLDGRLGMAEPNAPVYAQWAPLVAEHAPGAVFLAVTDPPDPLADLAATLAPDLRVISSGTLIDTLRFRYHLASALGVEVEDVDAVVLGEHGLSAVQLWSQARVAGWPVAEYAERQETSLAAVEAEVRDKVRLANIAIIEGTGASQFGIGVAVAEIVESIVCDRHRRLPVGSRENRFGVTLSLPSVVGRAGVLETITPPMTDAERAGLEKSAETIWKFSEKIGAKRGPRVGS